MTSSTQKSTPISPYVQCLAVSSDGWYCTREAAHGGEHIATNERETGPDIVGKVYKRWLPDAPKGAK